jgi:hypothetical protein
MLLVESFGLRYPSIWFASGSQPNVSSLHMAFTRVMTLNVMAIANIGQADRYHGSGGGHLLHWVLTHLPKQGSATETCISPIESTELPIQKKTAVVGDCRRLCKKL